MAFLSQKYNQLSVINPDPEKKKLLQEWFHSYYAALVWPPTEQLLGGMRYSSVRKALIQKDQLGSPPHFYSI